MTARDAMHEDLAAAVVRVGIDELADELADAARDDEHTLPFLGDVGDHLLAAGWSRPRVVTTSEATLDALMVDLFEAIERHVDPWASRTREIQTWSSLVATDLAERWVPRPRVVTTVAELDELPAPTAVVARTGVVFQKFGGSANTLLWWATGSTLPAKSEWLVEYLGPLTVVWSPPVESETVGWRPETVAVDPS